MSPEIKVTYFERNKKYIARNTIVNKTIGKGEKSMQQTNKKHIVEQALDIIILATHYFLTTASLVFTALS